MEVIVLASGSRGNATYVELGGTRVLIDAGISATRIKKGLESYGVDVAALDGIFITHEHRDHVAGLATLAKRYHLPIFSRQATLAAIPNATADMRAAYQPIESAVRLPGVTAECFSIPHDAADPVGYRLRGAEQVTVATDIGFVTQGVQAAIDGADVLILEANHDRQVLQQGSYPWHLKKRILSNRGHLANLDTAWALARLQKRPREVILAHLSEENNRPELARATVEDILTKQGIALNLTVASQVAPVTVH